MVQKWMFGESHHAYGRLSVCGMWPPSATCRRMRQWPKFGNDTMACRPMRSMCSSTTRGWRVACKRLRQDHVVEGVVRIVGEVGVGVALDHRETLGDAFVDALARQLDAAAVDAAPLAEQAQQFAVAAADVEHARARRHHVGDQQQIDARAARRAGGLRHGEIALETGQHRHLSPRLEAARLGRRRRGSRARWRTAPARRAGRRRGPCR